MTNIIAKSNEYKEANENRRKTRETCPNLIIFQNKDTQIDKQTDAHVLV